MYMLFIMDIAEYAGTGMVLYIAWSGGDFYLHQSRNEPCKERVMICAH